MLPLLKPQLDNISIEDLPEHVKAACNFKIAPGILITRCTLYILHIVIEFETIGRGRGQTDRIYWRMNFHNGLVIRCLS